MVLRASSGGEEGHSHLTSGDAVGLWENLVDITLDSISGVYTGTYSFKLGPTADGASPVTATVDKAWWSHTVFLNAWGGGTYRCLFSDLVGTATRWVGLKKGSSVARAKLGLWSDNTGTVLAESAEFVTGSIQLFKWECDAGNWTFWGKLVTAAGAQAWASLFTYDDSASYPTFVARINPQATTDEGKGEGQADPFVDDINLWDDTGDSWNSRIPLDDFPRNSVAHMPVDPDNATPDENDVLDEIPVGGDRVDIDKTDYYTAVEDLDETGSATHPDLTGETIQAVMVTHAAYNSPSTVELAKYNLYDGSTEFLDSEECLVQIGSTADPGDTTDATWAGSYPLTPNNENWTETLFEAYSYGISLIDGKSDQLTVQVIFFGDGADDWEWPVPAAARRIFNT